MFKYFGMYFLGQMTLFLCLFHSQTAGIIMSVVSGVVCVVLHSNDLREKQEHDDKKA